MKKNTILITFLLAISALSSCSQDFEKLSKDKSDEKKVEIAENFYKGWYSNLKAGNEIKFGDELTAEMKSVLEVQQKPIFDQVSTQFGDFISMEYAESWMAKNLESMEIIRFKGTFDKSDKVLEIRVVVDDEGKIAGFYIKPWLDPLT